jgi:hypothetical protein
MSGCTVSVLAVAGPCGAKIVGRSVQLIGSLPWQAEPTFGIAWNVAAMFICALVGGELFGWLCAPFELLTVAPFVV